MVTRKEDERGLRMLPLPRIMPSGDVQVVVLCGVLWERGREGRGRRDGLDRRLRQQTNVYVPHIFGFLATRG